MGKKRGRGQGAGAGYSRGRGLGGGGGGGGSLSLEVEVEVKPPLDPPTPPRPTPPPHPRKQQDGGEIKQVYARWSGTVCRKCFPLENGRGKDAYEAEVQHVAVVAAHTVCRSESSTERARARLVAPLATSSLGRRSPRGGPWFPGLVARSLPHRRVFKREPTRVSTRSAREKA